ncbi:MAG: hypothetical protein AAGD01_10245 [Acidobacteriota bacterium]
MLSASLYLGALYDLFFAGLMLIAPQLPARLLGLPLPGEPFYLHLMAVFLCMLASLYLIAARDVRRHSEVVLVAALGRLAGAAVFALATLGRPELGGLWVVAAADLAFGLVHGLGWWQLQRGASH